MEGGAVGTRAKITSFEATFGAFLLGAPHFPPFAAVLLEVFLGASAIDEGEHFADGGTPEFDFAFSDDRGTVFENVKAHNGSAEEVDGADFLTVFVDHGRWAFDAIFQNGAD